MKNFKNLKVWQKGIDIVISSYKLTDLLPSHEKFGLVSQINRSAVSIPSNIAEGSSRDSKKDFNNFLRIALGSSFELETQVLIVEKLSLVDKDLLASLKISIDEEQKMLMALMKSLKN